MVQSYMSNADLSKICSFDSVTSPVKKGSRVFTFPIKAWKQILLLGAAVFLSRTRLCFLLSQKLK